MNANRLTAALLFAALIVSAAVPAAAGAQTATPPLQVDVEQAPETGNATVTVTNESDAPVAGAAVTVESDSPYAGNGSYETDAQGTVELPNPADTVEVSITASDDGNATTTTLVLVPREDSLDVSLAQDAANDTVTATVTQYGEPVDGATVGVSANRTYAGNGTYETDADGTATFVDPERPTSVTVTAEFDGLSDAQTATLAGDALDVSVEQAEDGAATVTVTRNGSAVENATVEVATDDENATYAGNGTYETDVNGTVALPNPEANVTVTVTAAADGQVAATTVTIVEVETLSVTVEQTDDAETTVRVALDDEPVDGAAVTVETTGANASYDGVGDYETDADGAVDLPTPQNESIEVRVTATAEGKTAETTATLRAVGDLRSNDEFAEGLTTFIQQLKEGGFDGPMGLYVADYIMLNKPGGVPDKAQGPPAPEDSPASDDDDGEDDGPGANGDDANAKNDAAEESGRPDHAGKPDHAGGADDADGDDSDDADGDDSDDSDADSDDSDADSDDSDDNDEDDDDDGDSSDDDRPGNGNGKAKGRN